MDDELERVLNKLEDAAQFAKRYRFELSDEYLSLIEAVEALPRNQSGADKSGIWQALHAYVDTFRHMQPAPREP